MMENIMQEVLTITKELKSTERKKEFKIKILGRLLEHLGVQMYKHRDAAIAELIANAWDAGAENVWVTIPEESHYDKLISEIYLEDDGCGMDENDLQDKYLVIGRNRRSAENSEEFNGRKVMGRKGIGKLAGFGIATKMKIETWLNDKSIELELNLIHLKNNPITETKEDIEKKLEGTIRDRKPYCIHNDSISGTKISLSILKQKSPIKIDQLHVSIARRFSRTVQGRMKIFINSTPLKPLEIELHKNSPQISDSMITEKLSDGNTVKYSYSYSNTPIRQKELQGWTILANGKTAQAPPFFFYVDSSGKSQHSSKYLIGTIEADFLDKGSDDESDNISTDRQEIDWEREETKSLWEWGSKLTQKLFNEIAERNADESINIVLEDPTLNSRIEALDLPLRKQCLSFIGSIGSIKVANDEMPGKEKVLQMADQIIKAFEYRHFVDVIEEIEVACSNPESFDQLITHLEKWEVLESRSILEVIKGRLVIVQKFHELLVNDAPETANRNVGADNIHDLIAGFPWLLNSEWQILDEEKTITKQLREWGFEDIKDVDSYKRYDFLGMVGNGKLVIIEIKRSNHPVELEELQRIDKYKNKLSKAHPDITCVLIFGGNHNINQEIFSTYHKREDFKLLTWDSIYQLNHNYYDHYKAVLEGHISHPDFNRKIGEVGQIKKILTSGSIYRDKVEREKGLGPQDLNN